VPENPYGIGLFSSGQDRPGPPHKIRIPLGLVKILLILQGFFATLSDAVQQRATTEPSSVLAGEPPERVDRVHVFVRAHAQIALGRDPDSTR
jgi:hypothetical protein